MMRPPHVEKVISVADPKMPKNIIGLAQSIDQLKKMNIS